MHLRNNWSIIVGIIAFLLVFSAIYTRLLWEDIQQNDMIPAEITTYEACVQAGYPIMESYPRQCHVPNVGTFVEVLEVLPEIVDNDKNTVACTLDAKICPDGSAVGRIPPDCEFEECGEKKLE